MIAKASLTNLTTLETVDLAWNPESYRVRGSRRSRWLRAAAAPAGGLEPAGDVEERFTTRLLVDTTESEGSARDSRLQVERLEAWEHPEPASGVPPTVLFLFGTFRFRGIIEELCQEWVLFDPDGTPTRGWVDLTLRREPIA